MISISNLLLFLASSPLTIFFAIFSPSLQFISLNQKFYSKKQIHISLSFSFCLAILFSCFTALFLNYFNSIPYINKLQDYHFNLANALVSFCALQLFFILNERFFTEIFPNKNKEKKIKLALLLVFVSLCAFYSCGILNAVFLLLILSSIFDLKKKSKETKEILFDERVQQSYSKSYTARGIELKHKPNIYLLLLESYHSAKALKELYDIDDTKTDNFLKEHGFTDYENVFSNSHITFPSIANILHCRLQKYSQHTSAYVLDVLRENGYACEFFDSQFYVYGEYMQSKDYANFALSARERYLYLYFAPILGQSKFFRKFARDIDPFKTKIDFIKLHESFVSRLAVQSKKPTFYALRFGADHVNVQDVWKAEAENFTKNLYPALVQGAQNQIQVMVQSILTKDPKALILAIGDHGGLQNINIADKNKSLQETLENRKVSNEEFALDMFSVRCAIRWTHSHTTEGKIISHVNIFNYIFESLGAKKELLAEKQANISIYNKTNDIIVKEGIILDEVEEYYSPELFAKVRKAFEEGKASIENCLLLSQKASHKEKYEIFTWAINKYPDSEEIQLHYLNSLYDLGMINEALAKAKGYWKKSNNSGLRNFYPSLLSEIYPQDFLAIIKKEKEHSHSLEMHYHTINAFIRTNNKEKALEQLDAMMAAFPKNQSALFFLAKTCIGIKEARKAIPYFTQITQPGKFYNFWKCLTLLLIQAKLWEDAESTARILVKMHPTEAWSWLIYAYTLQVLGKVKEVVTVLRYGEIQSTYPLALQELLGHHVIKNNLQEKELQNYRAIAQKQIEQCIEFFASTNSINKQWYKSQSPNLKTIVMPQLHYVTDGVLSGFEPAPWFNSMYYLLNTPEVWLKGLNPYIHFYQTGIDSLLSASLYCNVRKVLFENPDIQGDAKAICDRINRNAFSNT